jgi:hypothetical protein
MRLWQIPTIPLSTREECDDVFDYRTNVRARFFNFIFEIVVMKPSNDRDNIWRGKEMSFPSPPGR